MYFTTTRFLFEKHINHENICLSKRQDLCYNCVGEFCPTFKSFIDYVTKCFFSASHTSFEHVRTMGCKLCVNVYEKKCYYPLYGLIEMMTPLL